MIGSRGLTRGRGGKQVLGDERKSHWFVSLQAQPCIAGGLTRGPAFDDDGET